MSIATNTTTNTAVATNIATIAAEQMLDILDGRPPSRVLNPEVWPAYAARFEAMFGFVPAPPV